MQRMRTRWRLLILSLAMWLTMAYPTPIAVAGSGGDAAYPSLASHGFFDLRDGSDHNAESSRVGARGNEQGSGRGGGHGNDRGGKPGDDDDDDDDGDADLFVPNQVVVKLQPGVPIGEISRAYRVTVLDALLDSSSIYLLQTPQNTGVEALIDVLEDDPRFIYVEPNFYGEAPEGGSRGKWAWGGTDPAPTGTQYAAAMLRLPEAHALSRGGGRIVAILDTGFQLDHPALANRLTAARYDFVDDDPTPTEDFANLDRNGDGLVDESAGHGTHVAGIVGLAAPDAQMMPVRVLDADGRGNVFLIAEAVLFAAHNGAHVINLSLGTTGQSSVLADVIGTVAESHGVVVIAAAGNLGDDEPVYPAAEEVVIAVTAVDRSQQRPGFANHGDWVDVSAPGDEIYSAFPVNQYAFWSGTSMATPFVAAQAALLGGRNPALTAEQIRTCVLATAQPLDSELGAGLANPAASLVAADSFCPAPSDSDGAGGDNDDDDDDDDDDDGRNG